MHGRALSVEHVVDDEKFKMHKQLLKPLFTVSTAAHLTTDPVTTASLRVS